jgi:hypothetical protein
MLSTGKRWRRKQPTIRGATLNAARGRPRRPWRPSEVLSAASPSRGRPPNPAVCPTSLRIVRSWFLMALLSALYSASSLDSLRT